MGTRLALETGDDLRKVALHDYRLACISREASLLGRKEVLTGKAKFGIFELCKLGWRSKLNVRVTTVATLTPSTFPLGKLHLNPSNR